MSTSNDTPRYGKRLLPQIIDERAKSGYSRPFAMYPKSTDSSAGFHSISYARVANAVNRLAWWLDSSMPDDEEKEVPFAYFGPNDLRFVIYLMAVMKTGRKVLYASPRNTVKAQLSLFEKTGCRTIVLCPSVKQSLQFLIETSGLRQLKSPGLDQLLAEDLVPHYEYNVSWEESTTAKFLTIHTSGSSGDPKPIPLGKSYLGGKDCANCLPEDQGEAAMKASFSKENVLALLPGFHAGGIGVHTMTGFLEVTLVLGHPDVPISSEYALELLKTGPATVLISPPSILEDLSKDEAALEALSKLKHVAYGGGPLGPSAGKILAGAVPHLFSIIGSTEVGIFHIIMGSSDLYDSLHYFDNIGYRFDEVSEGMFEHVIVNDERTNKYHHIFDVFPELSEYRTKDLYSPHPTAPGWRQYRGRIDDLIVLSNGEKIDPIPMENKIQSHPSVRSCLVIGGSRFNACLLLELKDDQIPRNDEDRRARLEEIWPVIKEANEVAPGHGKILKPLVMFSTIEKPFLRAGKGTVQRQLTVKAYEKEVDDMYASQEGSLLIECLTLTGSNKSDDIKIFVREILDQALDREELKDSDDIFQKGLDSLGVSVIVRRLKTALKVCFPSSNFEDISPRLIYGAATVDELTCAIMALIESKRGATHTNGVIPTRKARMQSMLEKFSTNFPSIDTQHPPAPVEGPWTVLLTGTTGSLGTHLLAALDRMSPSKISKIICLNRSADAKERQRKSNVSRGIDATWHDGGKDSKVEFFQADFSKESLGLDSKVYADLLQEVTVVIHTAWQVNFNLSIDSFEPQVQGVRNFLDFSSKSANKAPFLFISSISTAMQWMDKHSDLKVPESIISAFEAPRNIGYGESKYVSEHLVDKFAAASGITTAVLRTGQIAGPVIDGGLWNKQEWLPSIIASSKHLGILPVSLATMETVDWIPVDLLSTMIVELAEKVVSGKGEPSQGTTVYNLVNPEITTWKTLLPAIQDSLGIEKTVPFSDWVEELHQSSFANNGALIEANPGVKLLDFYRGVSEKSEASEGSRYIVDNLRRDSKQASDLRAVSPDWMKSWLKQWNF
ncbi:related to nonribosomal peptide synthetase MxcG (component of the myxochelin iron transport regulon) [Rhynchosporium graminicola]|uniref:Related to nonribosomal peptide synthetase MxcG (Component of the myxochelin iron transport regulon) n=1 Tax=Rhynchosporium graminicola TaxID=2792576 RepID=A0A1E1K4I0_9HELO|nr:related to nonribosomal peptide synthetase MxcG (component of the myxochelin iron transport regulon) [Rhynchosporium commune]